MKTEAMPGPARSREGIWECKDGFYYFDESVLPVPPLEPSPDWIAATAQSLSRILAGIGPFYIHFGGAGDALLLLATFLDKSPDAQVISFPNSIPAARSFFEAFPTLRRVWFLPKNKSPHVHLMLRMMMRHVPNYRGMGITPEIDYFKEWSSQLDIFKKWGVVRRPEWIKRFRTHPQARQIALAPQGSLQGMCGSKQNIIHRDVWPELLRFILERGFQPVILGTPDERKLYPVINGCEDRRSHCFGEQMEWIANSAALIGADSWAKTFSALLGLPTIVFEPLKGADWAGRKDPSDYVFLDPWDTITVVKNLNACRNAFDGIFSTPAPVPAASTAPNAVAWLGSFLDHGSLSHVNRELTMALETLPGIRLRRVKNGAPMAPGFEKLAGDISGPPPTDTALMVRHAWPPDWKRPLKGKLVVVQPWEFGALPKQWVIDSSRVDEFWVPSDYVRRIYIESGVPANKVAVVPNGVNPQIFHPQAAPMRLATQKKFKFLFVGGTIFRKGPDLLLKAYLGNFTAADDVCLVIKDSGGQNFYAGQTFESNIRAAQSQPDAPEILYLNHELPPDALPGLYTACDCLVLPYRGEGFGLPVLEAMACGLPVIVTAGGATDDFVREEFAWRIPAQRMIFGNEISGWKLAGPGWLLEPDVATLGRLLREVSANPAEARQRGERAAHHARQFWTWQHSATIAAQRIHELSKSRAGQNAPQSGPAAKTGSATKVKITLPPCALVGHLAEAHALTRQKQFDAAWSSTLAALGKRPFHPEACLLLAEIALAVGDGRSAKLCAEEARRMAPGWKPAKTFLSRRFSGSARRDSLALPMEIQEPNSRIQRLSVCLIVKNEEEFLGQCLNSVRDVASQIIVVDTGSTDRTIAIAREHGAEVHSFAWCDDFSAARNAALEHATGDWILMLDADEELSADGVETLKSAMKNPDVMAWRLPMTDVGREADGVSYVPRLYRNAPALFYIGRVHEQIFSSIEVRRGEWGLENRVGDARLIHHGYTAQLMRDRNKIERNLRLLERAIEELPNEPHLLMNYGLELSRSGRKTEALERYREAFQALSSRPTAEIVPELCESLLAQLCAELSNARQFDEIVSVLTSPLAATHGLTASLHFSLGLAQLELRRFSEAADQMRQCLAKRRRPCLTPINKDINTPAPHHCLALSLAQCGDDDDAEKAFQEGLKETGPSHLLRLDYARFLAGQNRPVDALQRLHEIVTVNAGQVEPWRLGGQIALSRPEFLEFARDWTKEAIRHAPNDPMVNGQRAEALMLSGDTAAAIGLWKRVWDKTSQPTALAALILCETVESPTTHAASNQSEETAASRAFIAWYQKLVAAKANRIVSRLNDQTDKLSRTLPAAAKLLEAAITEAGRATAVNA